jgi:hypothetical protein
MDFVRLGELGDDLRAHRRAVRTGRGPAGEMLRTVQRQCVPLRPPALPGRRPAEQVSAAVLECCASSTPGRWCPEWPRWSAGSGSSPTVADVTVPRGLASRVEVGRSRSSVCGPCPRPVKKSAITSTSLSSATPRPPDLLERYRVVGRTVRERRAEGRAHPGRTNRRVCGTGRPRPHCEGRTRLPGWVRPGRRRRVKRSAPSARV